MKSWKNLSGIELSFVSRKEKLIAGLGGLISILLLVFFSERTVGLPHATALVASMGASAVLIFAVPHGQLSQPWPVVGGQLVSALIGVACAKWIPFPGLAAACAVGISIAAMHELKCLHPPGGATALTAVLGGPAIHDLGYGFAFCPVLLNTVSMVAVGFAFNYPFPWRRYPAALVRRKSSSTTPPRHSEIVEALKSIDSFVDITEDDLVEILDQLEKRRVPPQIS